MLPPPNAGHCFSSFSSVLAREKQIPNFLAAKDAGARIEPDGWGVGGRSTSLIRNGFITDPLSQGRFRPGSNVCCGKMHRLDLVRDHDNNVGCGREEGFCQIDNCKIEDQRQNLGRQDSTRITPDKTALFCIFQFLQFNKPSLANLAIGFNSPENPITEVVASVHDPETERPVWAMNSKGFLGWLSIRGRAPALPITNCEPTERPSAPFFFGVRR